MSIIIKYLNILKKFHFFESKTREVHYKSKNKYKNWSFGITNKGEWIYKKGDSIVNFSKDKYFLPAFPLLEIKYNEFEALLRKKIPTSVIKEIPLLNFIEFVIKNDNAYWFRLAFDWCLNLELRYSIIEILRSKLNIKTIPQKRRKSISELILKWERTFAINKFHDLCLTHHNQDELKLSFVEALSNKNIEYLDIYDSLNKNYLVARSIKFDIESKKIV